MNGTIGVRWVKLLGLAVIGASVACSSGGGADNGVLPSNSDDGPDIESGPSVDETGDELASPMYFATDDSAVCPTGATFDDASGFCTQGGRALGPFTQAMVDACKSANGATCDDVNLPLSLATTIRGTDTCPKGASIDPTLGVCADDTYAYGPFLGGMVDDCTAAGGGDQCTGLRMEKKYVAPLEVEDDTEDGIVVQSAGGSCGALNARMYSFYSTRAGYAQVSRAGLKTLGTRHNGCATWVSQAIRMSGGHIPIEESTNGLRDALKKAGWTTIRNRNDLQPGDVIITKDRKGEPGHPDHTYVFGGWSGNNPIAIDNQGFTHVRTAGKSPIAYGLRAPSSSQNGCAAAPQSGSASTSGSSDNTTAPQKDYCGDKSDGWYCSEQVDFGAFECKGGDIVGGWQCGGGTVCRPTSDGHATMYGDNPGCYGSK
jgi:hypothetical protein